MTKISGLPPVTFLDGSEQVPLVQGGTTKRANASMLGATSGTGTSDILTANRTYYVRTDGSNTNDGLTNTAAGAFLTVQYAMNVVGTIDFNFSTYQVTIQVADGTYTEAITCPALHNCTTFPIVAGNASNVNGVIITNAGNVVIADGRDCTWKFQDMQLYCSTQGVCIRTTAYAQVYFGGNFHVNLTGPTASHFSAATFSRQGNYTSGTLYITGTGRRLVLCQSYGNFNFNAMDVVVNAGATFTDSCINIINEGHILWTPTTQTGTATGKSYGISDGGTIDCNGQVTIPFPPGDGTGYIVGTGTFYNTNGYVQDKSQTFNGNFNNILIYDAATSSSPRISALGSDTDVAMKFSIQGTPSEPYQFNTGTNFNAVLELYSSANSQIGPSLRLQHDSSTPASSDSMQIIFQANDSNGNVTNFSFMEHFVDNPADGSETGRIAFRTRNSGSLGYQFHVGGGVTVGSSPLATSPGQGSMNMYGGILMYGNTVIPSGGTAGSGLKFSTTTNYGVFFGSGAPTLTAAQGSLYLRSDGGSTNSRMYVNTLGTSVWAAVITES